MATLQYHDWASQTTPALRLARIRLHHAELTLLINTPDVASDGNSLSRATLHQRLTEVERQMNELERSTAASGYNGGFSVARFRAPSA